MTLKKKHTLLEDGPSWEELCRNQREDPVMLEPVHIDRLLMASDLNDVIFETRPGLNKLMPEVVYINLFSLTLAQPNAEQEPEGD